MGHGGWARRIVTPAAHPPAPERERGWLMAASADVALRPVKRMGTGDVGPDLPIRHRLSRRKRMLHPNGRGRIYHHVRERSVE